MSVICHSSDKCIKHTCFLILHFVPEREINSPVQQYIFQVVLKKLILKINP